MAVKIQVRRDTAANWTTANPVLSAGEIGFETNTAKIKIGDGSTAWNALAYFAGGGGGSAVWGSITGTLSGQIDLQTALNGKQASLGFTPENIANKGQASGYASLDASGQIPAAQIPTIAITEYLGSVANQAAMLALSGQKGDWCTRSDTGTNWIITGTDPSQLSSWTQLTYPAAPVTSVAGRTGAVTLSTADISGLGTAAVLNVPPSGDAASGEVVKGNDSRLTNSRTPTAHATTHHSGGSDAIKIDDLATPDDNTDLNATSTRHGLLPKLSNVSTEFLNGLGAWATPAGGGGGTPGGSDKQVQFNSAGAFGGAAGVEYQSGASPNLSLTAQNAAHVPLAIQGAASHATYLQRWVQSSGATIALFVTAVGRGLGFATSGGWFGHFSCFDPGNQTDNPAWGIAHQASSASPTESRIGFYSQASRVSVGVGTHSGDAARFVHATPVTGYLSGTGGSGTNIAGGDLVLEGGPPTGSANGGKIRLQTAAPGASGTTLRTLVDRFLVDTHGVFEVVAASTVPASNPPAGSVYLYAESNSLKYRKPDGTVITIGSGGGLTDGDYGEITVGGSGTTLTIDNDAVTYAKIQNVSATDKLLGRSTAGAGDVEEIPCTAAGRAILDDADATAQRATLGLVIGTDVQAFDANTAKLNVAQEYTKAHNFDQATLTDGATISWNLDDAQVAVVTLGGNRTLSNPTNMKAGGTYIVIVKQDGTGSRTLAYGTNYKWPFGTAPTLSTGANAVDVLSFVSDGTNMYGTIQKSFG